MVVLSTLGYIGAAFVVAVWTCRKVFTRSFGTHDASDEESVEGKTVLITGANSGLGKEAALAMAKRGATVILASRNMELTNKAIEEIKRKISLESQQELIPMRLDLASLQSIRDFADQVKSRFDKIDILINNAGVYVPLDKRMKTEDGFEFNMGINHLGHFLLTNLLLDLLKTADPSRVVIVASRLSDNGVVNFDDLMLEKTDPKTTKPVTAYANSKLANLYFAKELAARLPSSNVHVYALCPGWVKTDLARYMNLKWHQYLMMIPVAFIFMRTPKQGVQTILHCSLSKKVSQETGLFYRDCKYWTPKVLITPAATKQLWETSSKLVKL